MTNYDSELQMFVQTPREINMNRLSFMRWLGENGRLEHKVVGPPSGALVPLVPSRPDAANRVKLIDKP